MDRVAAYIGDDETRFEELMRIFLGEDFREAQLAAWAVSISGELHPQWLRPYIGKMLDNLERPVHPAVIRATVRTFQFTEIPKRYQARVIDQCFTYLSDLSVPIAIRVFSLTVLGNLAVHYPELKQELRVVLETQLPFTPPAIKSRLKQIKL